MNLVLIKYRRTTKRKKRLLYHDFIYEIKYQVNPAIFEYVALMAQFYVWKIILKLQQCLNVYMLF